MADALSLHELISALTGAVTEAQDAIQKHQLDFIGKYFDADGKPLSYALQLPNPSVAPGAETYHKVVVPLLSVVEPSLLSISEFTATFRVELGSIAASASASEPVLQRDAGAIAAQRHGAPIDIPRPPTGNQSGGPPAAAPPAGQDRSAAGAMAASTANLASPPDPPFRMAVGLASGAKSQGPLAKLSVKVTSNPVSEGMSRLMNALNKSI